MAISTRCNYCSRQLPAWRIHALAGGAQRICDDCLEWHNKAIEFLAGNTMPGCQACGVTWEFLHDSTLNGNVRMFVVPRDGIYQILCATCIRPYIEKRVDLYRATKFGYSIQL